MSRRIPRCQRPERLLVLFMLSVGLRAPSCLKLAITFDSEKQKKKKRKIFYFIRSLAKCCSAPFVEDLFV